MPFPKKRKLTAEPDFDVRPSYIVKGDNPEEATKLCDYLIRLLPQVRLSNAGLARKLGVPANTVSI